MKQEMKNLPAFEGAEYYYHGAYEGEFGTVTHGFFGVGKKEAEAYLSALSGAGFVRIAENRIGSAGFYTLEKENTRVRVAFYDNLYLLKLVVTENEFFPPEPAETEKKVPASITQIAREGAKIIAPGMCLVVQATDGSYILIDSGCANDADADNLLKFLTEHNPNAGKPVIRTWMITHPHIDHMGMALQFLEKHHAAVELESIAANFPMMTTVKVKHEDVIKSCKPLIDRFRELTATYFPAAREYMLHTGDVVRYPGVRMDILFTQEDFYPAEFSWVNHLSSAWMIRGAEKSALILGDCEKPLCRQMAAAYGEALKCDVLQLSHHGFNGACLELYRLADPDICFVPCDKERFLTDPRTKGEAFGYDFNAYLRNPTIKERTLYHSEETATVFLA